VHCRTTHQRRIAGTPAPCCQIADRVEAGSAYHRQQDLAILSRSGSRPRSQAGERIVGTLVRRPLDMISQRGARRTCSRSSACASCCSRRRHRPGDCSRPATTPITIAGRASGVTGAHEQCLFFAVAVNYVRGGAPDPSKPVLVLDRGPLDVVTSLNRVYGSSGPSHRHRSPLGGVHDAADHRRQVQRGNHRFVEGRAR